MAWTMYCLYQKKVSGQTPPPSREHSYRIAMDILDVCDPTGYRYFLVIADYFSKWTEAFPIKNKCADTVVDVLLEKNHISIWHASGYT